MIDVTNVVKRYGATSVLNGATFRIAEAQLTTILGPSGCGKSTMLRCLNRLEQFDQGAICIGDVEVRGSATTKLSAAEEDDLVNRLRMRVGLVFQNFNLFPHLTALENVIEAPMTVKKLSRTQAEDVGRLYLKRVGLAGREHEYPARLSGGQQQRVSIARALAMEPAVVLIDEPTSALDPRLVRDVAALLRTLDDLKKTLVVVTHDMDFAKAIALLKDSSLVSVIGLTELARTGQELASRYAAPLTIWPLVALLYLALTFPLTRMAEYLEHRWRPVTRA